MSETEHEDRTLLDSIASAFEGGKYYVMLNLPVSKVKRTGAEERTLVWDTSMMVDLILAREARITGDDIIAREKFVISAGGLEYLSSKYLPMGTFERFDDLVSARTRYASLLKEVSAYRREALGSPGGSDAMTKRKGIEYYGLSQEDALALAKDLRFLFATEPPDDPLERWESIGFKRAIKICFIDAIESNLLGTLETDPLGRTIGYNRRKARLSELKLMNEELLKNMRRWRETGFDGFVLIGDEDTALSSLGLATSEERRAFLRGEQEGFRYASERIERQSRLHYYTNE